MVQTRILILVAVSPKILKRFNLGLNNSLQSLLSILQLLKLRPCFTSLFCSDVIPRACHLSHLGPLVQEYSSPQHNPLTLPRSLVGVPATLAWPSLDNHPVYFFFGSLKQEKG
jgi:hypothetical protein